MITKKTIAILITFLYMIMITPLTILASYSDSITRENHIQTGDIHIDLKEYQIDSTGKESKYQFDNPVLPGDTISKIPRITNLAEPCYIRVHLTFPKDETNPISSLTAENLNGISKKWIKIQDYYYYSDILNTKESIDFFHSVHIPENWGNEHSSQELEIAIQVDAIQAHNFSPDFSSESPWGNQEIEICAHNQYEPSIKHPYQSMYVEFEGNSHKLITVSEDFFANLRQLMPGDLLSDEITLRNTTNTDAEFFFRTEIPSSITPDALELLEQISLEIILNEQVLYCGNLKSSSLETPISLGTYKKGETGTFTFSLFLPETAKNAYALRETSVKWIFSVKNEELKISTPASVKTSDSLLFEGYLLLLFFSMFLFGSFIIYKNKRRRTLYVDS